MNKDKFLKALLFEIDSLNKLKVKDKYVNGRAEFNGTIENMISEL